MASFLCVTILLTICSAVFGVVVRCPEEGCGNLTLYLGPKWGSKVIVLSQFEEDIEQRVPEVIDPVFDFDSAVDKLRTNATTHLPNKSSEIYKPPWWANRPVFPTTKRYERYDRPWRNEIPLQEYGQAWRIYNGTTMQWVYRPNFQSELNVTYMNITGTGLKAILSQLTNKTELRYLYLSHNNISDLPLFTFPMESELHLKELSMANNPMRYLTTNTLFEISRLHYLQKLNLSRTGLMYFDCPYLPYLGVLDISNSLLTSVPSSIERLPNLRQLILDHNLISYVYDFPHMYNLQALSLAGNEISYLRQSTFQSLKPLYTLNLSYNMLKNISQLNVSHYTTLQLSGNPWECSCPLLDFTQNSSYNIADFQTLTCLFTEYPYVRKTAFLIREEVHLDCPVRLDFWNWLMARGEQLEDVERWFRRRGVHMYIIYNAAIWIIFIAAVVFVACLFLRRQNKEKPLPLPPTDVPYTVLDDKMLA